jgi:nicotinate-nucleotide adenylyltransferase
LVLTLTLGLISFYLQLISPEIQFANQKHIRPLLLTTSMPYDFSMAIKVTDPARANHRLILGGSFNPIHYGHLICARAAAEALGFNQVVAIPSAQPPHKRIAADLASPADRYAMTALAITNSTLFHVNDIELKREGLSYTIDTARQLKNEGWGEINWLIGADMVQNLPSWHEPDRLLEEVNFILVARPGWSFDWDRLPAAYQHLRERVVSTPLIEISASDIRRRIGQGKSIEYLTPPAVIEFIARRKLYLP